MNWLMRDCPGRPVDGNPNTCTSTHEAGILYRHQGTASPLIWTLAGDPLDPDDSLALHRCGVCHALVAEDAVQPHLTWHNAEHVRNFSGF